MSYITVPLANGQHWGLHGNEIVIPGDAVGGMTATEIGEAVLALAALTADAHAFCQEATGAVSFEHFRAWVHQRHREGEA